MKLLKKSFHAVFDFFKLSSLRNTALLQYPRIHTQAFTAAFRQQLGGMQINRLVSRNWSGEKCCSYAKHGTMKRNTSSKNFFKKKFTPSISWLQTYIHVHFFPSTFPAWHLETTVTKSLTASLNQSKPERRQPIPHLGQREPVITCKSTAPWPRPNQFVWKHSLETEELEVGKFIQLLSRASIIHGGWGEADAWKEAMGQGYYFLRAVVSGQSGGAEAEGAAALLLDLEWKEAISFIQVLLWSWRTRVKSHDFVSVNQNRRGDPAF